MKKLSEQMEAKAYAKGVKARHDEVHPTKNPYTNGGERNFRAWLKGWTDTDHQIMDESIKGTFSDPSYAHSLLNPNNLMTGGRHGQFGGD